MSQTRRKLPRAQGTARGPVPRVLGRLLEPLYAMELARRNRRYDRGKGVRRVDRPVISIGNLTVGGTGKTPTVKAVLAMLIEAEYRPCVAMRGYKSTAATESDEAGELRRGFASVPVVANPDRWGGLQQLFSTPIGRAIDVVVLDDGFQHRRLSRDLDIVLVDATRDSFRDRLLPAGWLREPVRSLARVDVVVITHAESVSESGVRALRARIEGVAAPGTLIVESVHTWSGLIVADEPAEAAGGAGGTFDEARLPLAWLLGKRCVAVCAIGNPESFLAGVGDAVGGESPGVRPIVLPDHDPYAPSTVDDLIETARRMNAEAIVTTEKDWTKLRKIAPERWPCPIVRPVLEIVFQSGEGALRERVLRVASGEGVSRG